MTDTSPAGARATPQIKLWLSSDEAEGVFGDGKWRLLAEIGREGSLSAAAASLGMSYRKAWGDVRKAERCLGLRLIAAHRGGRDGGKTDLTECGDRWVGAYARFRSEVAGAVKEAFARHVAHLLEP